MWLTVMVISQVFLTKSSRVERRLVEMTRENQKILGTEKSMVFQKCEKYKREKYLRRIPYRNHTVWFSYDTRNVLSFEIYELLVRYY